jgi:putative NIF3 family GTP cyclohydrolase 1 type 2
MIHRRRFLTSSLAALAATSIRLPRALAGPAPLSIQEARGTMQEARGTIQQARGTIQKAPFTVQQVIDALLADIPGAPFPHTVDTIKAGDPGAQVKGIVTTMFATDAVIQKTIALGANFIIAHEPTFYNHTDETDWLGDVWRFHDGIHAHKPDGIRMGVMQALGWDAYYDPTAPPLVRLPNALPLAGLIELCKKRLSIGQIKYIGDLSQPCKRIVLAPGASGGRSQIGMIQKYQPDVLVCGELNEWETSEYIRDARFQGRKIALVVLGHAVSEEPGLEWLAPVLQKKVPGVPVTHLPSGDAFSWI